MYNEPIKTRPNTELTEIAMVLDRSGSMADMAKEAIGGFNSFLESHRLIYGLPLPKTHSPRQRHLDQPFEKGRLTFGRRARCYDERLKERCTGHLQRARDRDELSDEASRRKRMFGIVADDPRSNRCHFVSVELSASC